MTKPKLTDEQRLDRLVDSALKRAEDGDLAGKPISVAELNGLRRLLDQRTRTRELEELLRLSEG